MTNKITVDVAGGPIGGAARFRLELEQYLARRDGGNVRIIGGKRRLDSQWLVYREFAGASRGRKIALNNVSFVGTGGERWTLLGNALHFLSSDEIAAFPKLLREVTHRQAAVVRWAARRSDVLIAPCSEMADRVSRVLPSVRDRVVVRLHPVSPAADLGRRTAQVVLCPIVFSPYKHMVERITEWLDAADQRIDAEVRLAVTATRHQVPEHIAAHPRIELLGQLSAAELRDYWRVARAVYFPPGIESFGFALAEARAYGIPVIARDTAQNREIAGSALCGFTVGDRSSLTEATVLALKSDLAPDPAPFDPDAYFDWMLAR